MTHGNVVYETAHCVADDQNRVLRRAVPRAEVPFRRSDRPVLTSTVRLRDGDGETEAGDMLLDEERLVNHILGLGGSEGLVIVAGDGGALQIDELLLVDGVHDSRRIPCHGSREGLGSVGPIRRRHESANPEHCVVLISFTGPTILDETLTTRPTTGKYSGDSCVGHRERFVVELVYEILYAVVYIGGRVLA